jgi:hypothetical protein
MTAILPDIPNAPSGWNTENHYFYEIVNRTGNGVYIQFALSSRNANAEFLSICERINEFYKAKKGKKNWQWRLPFRTKTVCISDDLSKEQIFEKLDECLEEIQNFERDLKNKLSLEESAKA